MKAIILSGGYGTRLQEETALKPKPMVEIGGRPMLWHIMGIYAAAGFKEFVVALGYRAESVRSYFVQYHLIHSDLTVCLGDGSVSSRRTVPEDWTIHLIDTGDGTGTGGRVRRLASLIGNETFMLTYGDGVADIDLRELLAFHRRQGRVATVTAVRPPARFGGLIFEGDLVAEFTEKPQIGEGWINGGYMVFEPAIFNYLDGDQTSLEIDALERLASERQLAAFRHESFWQCMDTLRDKRLLEMLWQQNRAPWHLWS